MYRLILAFLFFTNALIATQPDSLKTYFDLLDRYPQALGTDGDASLGEIEIVRDREKIAEIAKQTGRPIGVVVKDKYWIWINDPVKFPSGAYGVYGRILKAELSGPSSVAVMPILENGKIALNRNYRHATRSWEYEIPRGGTNPGENHADAAMREVKEETGMKLKELTFLGSIPPDTGIVSIVVSVFCGQVAEYENHEREEGEAIASVDAFSIEEIKQGFIDGFLTVEIDGKMTKISLRDPFLAFALFQYEIRQ